MKEKDNFWGMSNDRAIEKIKELLWEDSHRTLMDERKRINETMIPPLNDLFRGLKLRYVEPETGIVDTVIVIEIGQLFETIRVQFPDGNKLWVMPIELELIELV